MAQDSSGGTRQKILEAAYRLFYRKGFSRVGVDEIAVAAGVTKRTLYYHFQSKDDLLAGVLDNQHALALARVQRDNATGFSTPEDVLASRYDGFKDWVSTRDWTGSGFTRLAMELADLPGHPARQVARRHKAEVEQNLKLLLEKSGSAASDTLARENSILLEGAMAMILVTGDKSYADVARHMALALLDLQRAP